MLREHRLYKLLAFDYDGTAAIDGQLPSERVCRAVDAARARGVVAVLATGRPYESAARYAHALGLDAPVICFQGAMVRELTGEKRVLYVEPAPSDAMCEVLAMAEARDLELNVYDEEVMYVIQRDRPADFYERWFGMPIRFTSSYAEICDKFAAAGKSPLKGLFIGAPETNDAFRDELRERFAGPARSGQVTRYVCGGPLEAGVQRSRAEVPRAALRHRPGGDDRGWRLGERQLDDRVGGPGRGNGERTAGGAGFGAT